MNLLLLGKITLYLIYAFIIWIAIRIAKPILNIFDEECKDNLILAIIINILIIILIAIIIALVNI